MDKENKSTAPGTESQWHALHLVQMSKPPGQIAGPRKAEECDGGEVVDEHLPEVFSLYVKKLKDGERPIERQLKQYF